MNLFHLGIPAVLSLVFLKLIVSEHLAMFVTRTSNAFWKGPPSRALFAALISTMVVGYLLVVFGLGITPIGNALGGFMILYSFGWFLVEDDLKLAYDRVASAQT